MKIIHRLNVLFQSLVSHQTKLLLLGIATCLVTIAWGLHANLPLVAHAASSQPQVVSQMPNAAQLQPFQLLPLPYAYDALAPYIDAQTMQLHHDKHHQTYVNNLNAAVQKHPELAGQSVEALLLSLDQVPEDIRTTVRNNAGGHSNHSLFWESMTPHGGGKPTGAIATALDQSFGSFDAFQQQFNEAAMKRFGSGWVWLIRSKDGSLQITTTANQDSPLMDGNQPLLGNDIWEHAYYLLYQNRRADYLNAWWNVVNWDVVNQRLARS
jgi:Fe-Mn family superoxide dismutase